MFPDMLNLGSQLVFKINRMGPANEIAAADDVHDGCPLGRRSPHMLISKYRLAIGICSFRCRFNRFYQDEIHPFAKKMVAALVEAGKRGNRLQVGG